MQAQLVCTSPVQQPTKQQCIPRPARLHAPQLQHTGTRPPNQTERQLTSGACDRCRSRGTYGGIEVSRAAEQAFKHPDLAQSQQDLQ